MHVRIMKYKRVLWWSSTFRRADQKDKLWYHTLLEDIR